MKKKIFLDLFGGQDIGEYFKSHGYEVIELWLREKPHQEIKELTAEKIIEKYGKPDVIWANIPCHTFSIASIGHHWNRDNTPKTIGAAEGLYSLEKTVQLIKELNPKYWFIENPRGKMRKLDPVQELPVYTIAYCQYGDNRMKPTDIWTNHPDPKFKPMCKRGAPCHEAAPRGSRKGTQKRSTDERRSLPPALVEHIFKICQE